MKSESQKGSQVYTPLSLKAYDWWVLNISNSYAWRCDTESVLLKHFQRFSGEKHMDIGVGTGYYLARSRVKPRSITLVDLNLNSLNAARARIASQFETQCLQHDILLPLPDPMHNAYDSVSMFYLLHCLPGNMTSKAAVIANAAKALKAEGTLYGATILGSGVSHNQFGTALMNLYNKKGIFSNRQDTADALHQILETHFREVEIKVCGTVALFSATGKTMW
ncbi:class I SAM-dependent methyltransferase [Pantoea sp. USHLN298]|uniref:class I SAM-dependent methyltransferase n=1 Tax=Pantoea sp. USHLN298 TaxID=3081294 RepID=UPI00301A9165